MAFDPITPIPDAPTKPDAESSLWNARYLEIDANFDLLENGVAAEFWDGTTFAVPTGTGDVNGHIINNEGSPIAQKLNMDFIGASVVAADGASNTEITVNGAVIGKNIEAITANKTLTDSDEPIQVLTPDAAWDVILPAEAATNPYFLIVNPTGSGFTLTIKDDGAGTITTVEDGETKMILPDGVTWYVLAGGGGITSPLTADLDFAKFKAVAMVADNGATLPSTPVNGQWFLHTPTGRSVLMMYDGASWRLIISYGTMAMFVDGGAGSDDQDEGTAAGASAFATVQFAIDQIPPMYGGNVSITIAAGTYAETLTVTGKFPTGSFNITLTGTLSDVSAGITVDGGVATSGATQGTVTDSGTSYGAWENKLLTSTANDNDGKFRIIDVAAAGSLSLIGSWDAFSAGGTYDVKDWATIITGVDVSSGQRDVNLENIKFSGSVSITDSGICDFNICVFTHSGTTNTIRGFATGNYAICLFDGTGGTQIIIDRGGFGDISRSKVEGTPTKGIRVNEGARLLFNNGSVIDGNGTAGIEAEQAYVNMTSGAGAGYPRIRNCGTGILATAGAIVADTSNNQYSGNSTDENPSGASDPAYID